MRALVGVGMLTAVMVVASVSSRMASMGASVVDVLAAAPVGVGAVARMAGWSAHRMEELFCAHRIIRPAYRPVIEPLEYKPLADR